MCNIFRGRLNHKIWHDLHYFHPNYRVYKSIEYPHIYIFIKCVMFLVLIAITQSFITIPKDTPSFPQSPVSYSDFSFSLFLLAPWRGTNKPKLSVVCIQIWTISNFVIPLSQYRVSPVIFGDDWYYQANVITESLTRSIRK